MGIFKILRYNAFPPRLLSLVSYVNLSLQINAAHIQVTDIFEAHREVYIVGSSVVFPAQSLWLSYLALFHLCLHITFEIGSRLQEVTMTALESKQASNQPKVVL